MEINITHLADINAFPLSHSQAEGGENAGRNTWNASKAAAAAMRPPLLPDEEALQEFRDWIKGFGAWSEDEIAAWSADECNALLLQFIAGDIREAGADSLEDVDWEEYEADESQCHNLFKSEAGEYFFSMAH